MAEYTREKLEAIGGKWLQRIAAAEKREKNWRDDAERAEKAYTNDATLVGKTYTFNILHSNVETIVPATYNSTPVPDIRRRFQDDDPTAKEVSDILERAITALIDDNRLDTEMEAAAQSAFLAGRGVVRLRFDADWIDDEPAKEALQADAETEGNTEEGEDYEPPVQVVTGSERILFEAWPWRDFRHGPAKRWDDVQWIAFLHRVPEEELERIGDKALLDQQKNDTETSDGKDEDIEVWEIWCKPSRTVKFIRENDRKVLRIEEDPLGLSEFFPIAPPVQPIAVLGNLAPINPFAIYSKLADELDLISKRIAKITGVMKVKGLSFGDAHDLQELAEADDGVIIQAANLEQLAISKGLDGAISWWPIEVMAQALAQLYESREQTKSAIYEITGISDIIRGESEASETATAQNIKTQWGSLRIRKLQRLLERQVRDIFVLMAEIISKHFSSETLMEMTGVQMTPEVEQLLRDDVRRKYRIDVESDSTIRADLTRQREEMSAFLNGTAEFFGAIGPVVEAKPEIAEPMTEVYAAFARNFNLGKSAEDALEKMAQSAREPQPEQEGPSPEEMQAQADAQAKQAQIQIDAQKAQMDHEHKQAQLALEREYKGADLELKRQDLQRQIAKDREELALKERELAQRQQSEHEDREFQERTGREQREAETKKVNASENVKAGIPADFSMQAIVDTMNAQREQQAKRDAEQSKAIQANAKALESMARMLGAPKEAVLSDGRTIRVNTRQQ